MWLTALRSHADAATLQQLPPLTDADAARVMARLRHETPGATPPAHPTQPAATPGIATGHFRPRITLMTLGRGDGLLGLRPQGPLGPRGDSVTLAQIDWTYTTHAGESAAPNTIAWHTPAPTSVLNSRPPAIQELFDTGGPVLRMQRNLAAEADAMDRVWDLGLIPVDANTLQWRHRAAAAALGPVWTLAQEAHFGDFWAEQIPKLRAEGWSVVVQPGFAHESVPVQRWKLLIAPDTGELLGKEVDGPLGERLRPVQKLQLPEREGAWLLSLGIEIDGETLDLAPMLADLLRRNARWLNARQMAAIDDIAIISLRAPGGKRIDAPAGPLKAIVGAMVDLLTDPTRNQRKDGDPLHLGAWEARRIEALRAGLVQAHRVGTVNGWNNAWQLQGDAGLAQLAQRLRTIGTPQPVHAPQGLQVQLRPYQLEGLAWLQYLRAQGLGGILADDMGLGKTAQALAHVLTEKNTGRLTRPALVVLPTSLLFNWQAEAARMAPGLRLLALHGPRRAHSYADITRHDLVLTTYPLLWRDVDALAAQPFHLLILDEAQMVKNAGSRSARALRKLQAPHLLCLTGTPLENHLGELWAQFDFLMPGFLGDVRSFNARWRQPIEENGETLRAQLLAQRVRPFILRRRKQDVATELPPRTETILRVQLQGKQRDLYEAVRATADKQVRRALERQSFEGAQITILDALLKLRQVCCDPRLVKGIQQGPHAPPHLREGEAFLPGGGPAAKRTAQTMERAKLELLADMLPALVDEGRRVLVFSQFTEMLTLAAELLDALALPYLTLTGQTPPRQRGAVVRQFQAQDDTSAPILLVSLKAGGVGLNLTAADTVIHLDPWWNPAVEEQATARAHRIGQDQPVFVYKLVVEGSIEERMLELQTRKAALAQGVLGHDAEGAVKFSEADLHALLAPLSEPANNPLGLPGEDALRWGGTGPQQRGPSQPPEF
ncbi:MULTISPECIES: DEAD/DEAH box helicase [unclassified Acidovorax]|jgi:superfamily II DNA or RNA helicase|uniref:DEAD/DEAH box helicase n=1 Tax=unclassified Acidovorax TaxID=2684926 RepID=UPI0025C65AA5|nr:MULTISPECIES: DEAD/DEAH box helicase [unclassified Acidovorax]HQS21432.1 DEAD/DEAH box helicase [Acidovorax defluvii]HQS63002.1 DEAD/DEAH box helicase [Acidovorax defluvii]HQT18511.1 DEAD/DEAH box helicase [Acidovorax defluvii]HQT50555.1 DEAD/DEAH box helicase [Acidovorax defluvii]